MQLTIIAPDLAETQTPSPLGVPQVAVRVIAKGGLSKLASLLAWIAIEPQLALLGETRGRKKRDVTQSDIAGSEGITQGTIRRWKGRWRTFAATHPEDAASLRAWWATHGPTLLPPGTPVNQETITAALLTRQLTV